MEDSEKCCWCVSITCAIVVVFVICSLWATVEPLEYGLECNSFTKTCDTQKSKTKFHFK